MSISRQPQGIPVGGQFAATSHAESAVTLTPARRPELGGWPEHLPEPEVSVGIDDAGLITTTVSIDGNPVFEVWNPGDDIHDIENESFDSEWLEDETVQEAAQKWSHAKHDEIAWPIRREMRAAADRVRAQVIAKATGIKTPATDDELSALIDNTSSAASTARRNLELASTALAARKILEDHPDAAYAGLRTASWDNGTFVDGAVVQDSNYKTLGEYSGESGEGRQEVSELLGNLDAEPANSHWSGEFSTGHHFEEQFSIDLRKAAGWTPGDEA
jgi:hypothetical protein